MQTMSKHSCTVGWPRLLHKVENMVQQCHTCAHNTIPVELPDYQVGTDLFHYKRITSLTMVETEIIAHHNSIADNITKAQKNIFSRFRYTYLSLLSVITAHNILS